MVTKGTASMDTKKRFKTRTGYMFKRGQTFYVQVKVNGRVIIRSTGETDPDKAEVVRAKIVAPFLADQEAEILHTLTAKMEYKREEAEALSDKPVVTVSNAWQTFLLSPSRPDSGERTLKGYAGQWKRFADWMETRRAGCSIGDVTEADAEAYATKDLAPTTTPNTYNKHVTLCTLVFKVLRKAGRIKGNPFAEIRRKRQHAHSRRELTVDELIRVCKEAKGEMRTLFAVGIYTGLRLGDCVTLKWGEVDITKGMIARIPNKTARRHPVPVLVPIHPALAAILKNTPANDRTGYVMPELATTHLRDNTNISKRLQEFFTTCNIETSCGKSASGKAIVEVGFHSLRHTFVSLCRAGDVPLSVVESIVGHSSPAMTQHYTHTGEAAARSAVGKLPDVTRKAPALTAGTSKGKTPAKACAKCKPALLGILELMKAGQTQEAIDTLTAML